MRLFSLLLLCFVFALIGAVFAETNISDATHNQSDENLVVQLFKKFELSDGSGEEAEEMKQFIDDLVEQDAVIRAALDDDKEQKGISKPFKLPNKPFLLEEYELLKSMEHIDKPFGQLLNKLHKINGNMEKSFFEGILFESDSKLNDLKEIAPQYLGLLADSWQIPIKEMGTNKENLDKMSQQKMLKELAKSYMEYKREYWQREDKSNGKGHGKGGQKEKRILRLLYNLYNDGINGIASADLKSDPKKSKQRKRRKRTDNFFAPSVSFWIVTVVIIIAVALAIFMIRFFCFKNNISSGSGLETDSDQEIGQGPYGPHPENYPVPIHPEQRELPNYYYYYYPPNWHRNNMPGNFYGRGPMPNQPPFSQMVPLRPLLPAAGYGLYQPPPNFYGLEQEQFEMYDRMSGMGPREHRGRSSRRHRNRHANDSGRGRRTSSAE